MKKLIVIIIIIALVLSGCTAGPEAAEQEQVTIWYIKGDVLESALRASAAELDMRLCLVPFDSMAELSGQLQGQRPDLLLCSYEMAATLQEQGMLKSLNVRGLDYTASAMAYPGVATGFFPVGEAVELLCGAGEAEFASLEQMLSYLSENELLMTADSFSRLMSSALMQRNAPLSSDRQENIRQEAYLYLYNLLAEAALKGSVAAFDDGGAELLTKGLVDYAVLSSTALTDIDSELSISVVPAVEEGKLCCMADLRGFAYLGNTFDNSAAVSKLLKELLSGGRGQQLALKTGLIPAQQWDYTPSDNALEGALFEIYSQWELILPSPVSGFVQGRQALELDIRAAIGYLQ